MEKVKKQAKQVTESTKRIVNGLEEFVIGIAVATTAFYNYYDLSIRPVDKPEYIFRLGCSVIVFGIGVILLVKHFNNRAK